jgi:hypothetical protein
MVHVDADDEQGPAARHVIDGAYVPRTFFLRPDGSTLADVHAARDKFRFFYDEQDPASLLAGMDDALTRMKH